MNKLIFKLFYLKKAFPLFFITLALFAGCAPKITGDAVKQPPKETAEMPQIYFCPRDDCSKVFEAHIKSANSFVHCAFYDIELENMISALAGKSSDIDVKFVMDSSTYEQQIKGDAVKLDDDNQLMHNKFCVIDGNTVLTGSFNPTYNGNNRNNNNVVLIYSNALAKNYDDEFNELWNLDFGKGNSVKFPIVYINNMKVENYFCPEDNCASRIIDLIKNAESSIHFMAFSFTNEDIADALVMKDNIDVRGIFDSRQAALRYSQFERLKEFGIKVKKDTNKYTMHHKVFIIDESVVVTGSFNPTLSADTKNDENLLIIHDKNIADAFLEEFDMLWE